MDTHSDVAKELHTKLEREIARTIPRTIPHETNIKAMPKFHNYTWDIWKTSDK